MQSGRGLGTNNNSKELNKRLKLSTLSVQVNTRLVNVTQTLTDNSSSAGGRTSYKNEEKAKVVVAAWGTELIKIPCRASYFAPGRFEEWDDFISS